jgi:hypothetical protein
VKNEPDRIQLPAAVEPLPETEKPSASALAELMGLNIQPLPVEGRFVNKLFFSFKWVLDQGPEQRESKMTVLCPLITIILISYIIIYYIINKLLIMENHPIRNQKRNSN